MIICLYSYERKSQKKMRALLIILDGWGLSNDKYASAIIQAKTPFIDQCLSSASHSQLTASGELVGLPKGQMGNSEVGHTHIGAGRVVYQDLPRIHKEITSARMYQYKKLIQLFKDAQSREANVHFMGLFSKGGVHAHTDHLIALCKTAHQQGINRTYVHAFLDGRDTPPRSAIEILRKEEPQLLAEGARIATCVGRYYAMDRDKRWTRTQQAYDLLTKGKGTPCKNLSEALQTSYAEDISDEFFPPHFITNERDEPLSLLRPGDLLLCFNFRSDRMRQLVQVLTQSKEPSTGMSPMSIQCATMSCYDESFKNISILYEKEHLSDTIGEVISSSSKTQLRIAETEKYPHVTYFFSGGTEQSFRGEKRILCPSPKVATYDLQPEMSAIAIAKQLTPLLEAQTYDFVCLNFANPDMVGHTGVFSAAVQACECVDRCAARVATVARAANYSVLIIADHGNVECMLQKDGSPHTSHTTNPVPCILLPPKSFYPISLRSGTLTDVAPTLLKIMGLSQPKVMTGRPLYE